MTSKILGWSVASALALVLASPAIAQKQYGPGVSDTEITIGQTMAYSGPASAYGTIGKADEAYIAMVNAHGGVNGRTIKLISLDDGYSPPKTVEQTRRLVESDQVLAIVGSLGTAPNTAIPVNRPRSGIVSQNGASEGSGLRGLCTSPMTKKRPLRFDGAG